MRNNPRSGRKIHDLAALLIYAGDSSAPAWCSMCIFWDLAVFSFSRCKAANCRYRTFDRSCNRSNCTDGGLDHSTNELKSSAEYCFQAVQRRSKISVCNSLDHHRNTAKQRRQPLHGDRNSLNHDSDSCSHSLETAQHRCDKSA